MALPIYEHRVTVTEDTVSPRGPLACGTDGDERAARLHFCFAAAFTDATEYSYRLEIVTGSGAYDITERLTIADNEIVYDIPAAWTAAGLAAVRLIQFAEQDGIETARRHFPPVALQFAYRDEGSGAVTAALRWQEYLTRAEAMLDEFGTAGDTAQQAARAAEACVEECRELLAQMETAGGAIIDDSRIGDAAWSSKTIVDTFGEPFTETGVSITCTPLAGYPLDVVSTIVGVSEDGAAIPLDDVTIVENEVSTTSLECLKAGITYTVSVPEKVDNSTAKPTTVRVHGMGSGEEWSDVNVATLTFTPTQDAYFIITFTYDTMPADAAAAILLEYDGEVMDGVSATAYQDYRVIVTTPVLQQGASYTLKIGTEETPAYVIATGTDHPPISWRSTREVTLTPLVTTAFEIWIDYTRIPDDITEKVQLCQVTGVGDCRTATLCVAGADKTDTYTVDFGSEVAGSYHWPSGVLTLEDGTTRQFTPQTIIALAGQNTLTCDAGEITVSGRALPGNGGDTDGIEEALDRIIDIQNNLVGGDGE